MNDSSSRGLSDGPAQEIRSRNTGDGLPWRRAAVVVGAIFALLSLQWGVVNNAPPSWDEAMYLIPTWLEWDSARHGGLAALYHTFLKVNAGTPGLLSFLGVPGFFIFGPSLKAAMAHFALLWLVSTMAICDFTSNAARKLFDLDDRQAGISAFFAVVIFAVYPMTQYKSQNFFVEFPTITCVAVLNACALRYWITGSFRWAILTGVSAGFGLLAKVTFPALTLAAVIFCIRGLWRHESFSSRLIALGGLLVPAMIIAGPFYLKNFEQILESTRQLASAQQAIPYGLGGAGDLGRAVEFVWLMLKQYEFLLCVIAAFVFLAGIWRSKRGRIEYLVIALSTLVPLLIVALSNFKVERYAFPGFLGLFSLAGCGFALLGWLPRPVAISLSALLLGAPVIRTAVAHQFLPPEAAALLNNTMARVGLVPFMSSPRPPDNRNWKIAEVSAAIERARRETGPILLLGESVSFHPNLMVFSALQHGYDQSWVAFPIHSFPEYTEGELLAFVKDRKPSVVVYKSGPYTLDFLVRHIDAAVAAFRNDPNYVSVELPFSQPDGAKFTIFAKVP